MPLLDLKTDLKSLKYGSDRPGGGDSGLPYIKTDINTVDSGFNRFRLTKFDDGLVRGGIIGALNASVVDTLRIGKFLTDIPKGPLFIVKQVGLQLSNPKLETKQLRTDRGGIFGAVANVANRINNAVGPTRIYNLGINTLAQVPVNAFGGHFNRHGLLPVQSEDTKYISVVQSNNENNANRLVGYKDKFTLGDRKPNETQDNRIINRVNAIGAVINTVNSIFGSNIPKIPNIKQDPKQLTIDSYLGGPGSVYGIGNTTIRRYSFTEDGFKINKSLEQSKQFAGKTRDDKGGPKEFNPFSGVGIGNKAIYNYPEVDDLEFNLGSLLPTSINPAFKTYSALQTQINKTTTSQLGCKNVSSSITSSNDIKVGEQLPSSKKEIAYKNSYGDYLPFKKSWADGTREVRVGSGRTDEINLTPVFDGIKYFGGDGIYIKDAEGKTSPKNIRDLIRFRIQAVDTDSPDKGRWMVFRAYLTSLSDETSPEWSDVKYAGRGDRFYIYNGFTRKINISFKIAALSEKEMRFIYQKLNFLMSNAMPDYGGGILMRGPLIRLSVGSWLDCQLGKLDSISINVPQDSPWEIAMDEPENTPDKGKLILPHVLEVTLGFTPFGAETRGHNLIPEKSEKTSYIAQNNTGNDVSTLQYIK
jgi:hypothetical protein